MALIDKASLLMVPSTYEAGKLYNVLPSGNRAPDSTNQNSGYDQSRADFTFDRGSNAAATRVNASGLIEKYRENLLLQSNNFGTTWATTNASVTSGQSGYDGLNNAWELKENTSTGVHEIIQILSVSTGVHTYSLKVSANTRSKMALVLAGSAFNSGGNGVGIFNLTNGTLISSSGSLIDAKITSLGGNWYNVSITKLASSSSAVAVVQLVDDSNNTNYAGNGTGSVLIQSAQLESGLVATDYLDSTSVTGKAGVLVDLPRINYDANGQNGSLLLEPSRANSVISSEYLGDSSWAATRMTQAPNQTTSPEGLVNATLIANTTDTGGHSFSDLLGSYTNAQIALTCYVKKKDSDYFQIGMYNSPTKWAAQKFNIATGVALGSGNTGFHDAPSNVDIVDAGNGWWRVQATFSTSLTAASEHIYLLCPYDDSNPTGSFGHYNGWTGSTSENAYVYGIQAEASATYPSSYIPTMGTSETRAADSCSVTGVSDVIGQTEGTLFLEFNSGALDGEIQGFSVNDGSSQNRIVIFKNQNDRVQLQVRLGGVVQASIESSDLTANTNYKAALAYANNDVVLYLNGTQVGTDTSATIPTCSDVCFDSDSNGGSPLFKETKQALLFKTRLTNAELAALTL